MVIAISKAAQAMSPKPNGRVGPYGAADATLDPGL